MIGTLGAAGTSFLATNLDTLAIAVPLLALAPPGPARTRILVGCCLGNAAVLALALLGAAGLGFLPVQHLRWAGLVPIGLGLYRLLPRRGSIGFSTTDSGSGSGPPRTCLRYAALILSLGIDNVAVLAPLLRALGPSRATAVIATHLVLFPALLTLPVLISRLRRRTIPLTRPASAFLSIAIGTAILVG